MPKHESAEFTESRDKSIRPSKELPTAFSDRVQKIVELNGKHKFPAINAFHLPSLQEISSEIKSKMDTSEF